MEPVRRPSYQAFTLLELLIVLAVLFILTAMFMPANRSDKDRAKRINCKNNLKQVGLSYHEWALDHADEHPMRVGFTNGGVSELIEAGYFEASFMVMSNELNSPSVLWCPASKRSQAAVTFATLGRSNLSYFVGLDAEETDPQMFLSGDDNWLVDNQPVKRGVLALTTNNAVAYSGERHKFQGNVGLADGSVQGFTSRRLQEALSNTGTNINRIAFP